MRLIPFFYSSLRRVSLSKQKVKTHTAEKSLSMYMRINEESRGICAHKESSIHDISRINGTQNKCHPPPALSSRVWGPRGVYKRMKRARQKAGSYLAFKLLRNCILRGGDIRTYIYIQSVCLPIREKRRNKRMSIYKKSLCFFLFFLFICFFFYPNPFFYSHVLLQRDIRSLSFSSRLAPLFSLYLRP